MIWIMVASFILGVFALVGGAEALVRGASRLAAAAGVSSLVIGLTVVAYGTSAPELGVAIRAALTGQADITVGNVVGANILNILLILGVSSLLAPICLSQELVRRDVPLLAVVSLALFLLSVDGRLQRYEGALLILGLIAYTRHAIRRGRESGEEAGYPAALTEVQVAGHDGWLRHIALVVLGLLLLAAGSALVVNAAVSFARAFGVSELVISLTIVAIGTTLPELATSALAARRGDPDITVGNVIGSSLFNIMGVLGTAALLSPGGLAVPLEAVRLDMPIMITAAVALLPVFVIGAQLERWEGAFFLGYYVTFVAYLYLRGTESQALEGYTRAMAGFAIPLTAVTLLALIAARRQARDQRARSGGDG